MKLVTIFITIIFFQITNAQVKLGLTVGVSSFDVNSDYYNSSSSLGTEFGSHVRYILDKSSEILMEVTVNLSKIEVEGREYVDDIASGTMKYKFNQSYLNIGAYYNYSIIPKKVSFFAGPTLSYSINTKIKDDIDGKDIRFGSSGISSKAIETIDPFLYLSAGITAGIDDLKLRLKYSYGLLNPYRDEDLLNPDTYEPLNLTAKTSFLSLSLMYSIDFY